MQPVWFIMLSLTAVASTKPLARKQDHETDVTAFQAAKVLPTTPTALTPVLRSEKRFAGISANGGIVAFDDEVEAGGQSPGSLVQVRPLGWMEDGAGDIPVDNSFVNFQAEGECTMDVVTSSNATEAQGTLNDKVCCDSCVCKDLSICVFRRSQEKMTWLIDVRFVLNVVKNGTKDARPMASWLYVTKTIQYQVDVGANKMRAPPHDADTGTTKTVDMLYDAVESDREMNDANQTKTIPSAWLRDSRFSNKDRERQIQQGRDILSAFRLLIKAGGNDEGYCSPNAASDDAGNKRLFVWTEDDFHVCGDSRLQQWNATMNWAVNNTDKWTAIRLARGNGGLVLQCRDIPHLVKYLDTRKGIPGIDWSIDLFYQGYQGGLGGQVSDKHAGGDSPNKVPTDLADKASGRLYRVTSFSLFQHNDGGVSTIWKQTSQTMQKARGAAGCDAMTGSFTWYSGFDSKSCSLSTDMFSPCGDGSPTTADIANQV